MHVVTWCTHPCLNLTWLVRDLGSFEFGRRDPVQHSRPPAIYTDFFFFWKEITSETAFLLGHRELARGQTCCPHILHDPLWLSANRQRSYPPDSSIASSEASTSASRTRLRSGEINLAPCGAARFPVQESVAYINMCWTIGADALRGKGVRCHVATVTSITFLLSPCWPAGTRLMSKHGSLDGLAELHALRVYVS
jgi:hypothetical protein